MVIDPGNNVNTQNAAAGKAKQQTPVKSEPSADNGKTTTPNTDDSVSLSAASRALTQLEAKIADSSEVDSAKVAEIKAQLANGSYQIDSRAIAEKMIVQERELG